MDTPRTWYQGRPTILKTRVAQLVTCVTLVVYGLGLVLWSEGYTSRSYEQAFRLLDPVLWGVLFVVVGALGLGALLGPRPYALRYKLEVFAAVCSALRVALVLFWVLLLFISVANFSAGTRLGPVVWIALVLIDLSSVVRFGTGKAETG